MQYAVAGYPGVKAEIDLVSVRFLNQSLIWSFIIDQVSHGGNFFTYEGARKQDRGISDEERFILCSVPDR
jgi:hypothetical protein